MTARTRQTFGIRDALRRSLVVLGTIAVGCAHGTTFGTGGTNAGGAGGTGGAASTTANGTTSATNASAGGSQATSTVDVTSTANGTTAAVTTNATAATGGVCGDGICDPGETCMNCPSDCPVCPTTAATTTAVTTGTGGGSCHDPCTIGAAMSATACAAQVYAPCIQDVCSSDSFCCTNMWDANCLSDVDNSFICSLQGYFC